MLTPETKRIKIIDIHYNTLCEVEDGQQIKLTYPDGFELIEEVKIIDDYHIILGKVIYHIYEFAERVIEKTNVIITKV